MKNILKFLLPLVLLLSSFALDAYEAGKSYSLSFFHVNDTHGAFYKDQKGEGGWAILGRVMKEARVKALENGTHIFLTSGGDVNTGVPESDLLRAKPDFIAMSALGFTAMVLGNHEFDSHWGKLQEQKSWATFPFLSANIIPNLDFPFPLLPYIIKEVDGLKVAFLGLSPDDIRESARPSNSEGLAILPSFDVAKKMLPALRANADVIVVLSHLGLSIDEKLASEVPGINLILGGHSHSDMPSAKIVGQTIIFQAFEKNKRVGKVDIEFLDGKILLKNSEIIPLVGEENSEILALLEPYKKESSEKLKIVIGKTDVLLDGERANVRTKETNLGNLVTLSIKEMTKADLVIINSGGLRASIPVGPITYADIIRVHPFGNIICTVNLTGAELVTYFEAIAQMNPGEGNFPQMSGVFLKTNKENKILSLKINDEEVLLEKKYKLALNDFMAEGGDHYPKVSDKPSFVNLGLTLEYMLRSYISEKESIDDSLIFVRKYYQRQVEE